MIVTNKTNGKDITSDVIKLLMREITQEEFEKRTGLTKNEGYLKELEGGDTK